jgi:Outer membrane protein beta-barrel domain
MSRRVAVLVMAVSIVGGGCAYAQESGPTPGTLEITYIPGGGAFFTSKNGSPSFNNYGLGTAATYNINRLVGIEGEVFGVIGTSSDLQFGNASSNVKAPNGVSYTGNVIVSPLNFRSFIPFGTAGLGGFTMLERPGLGVNTDETFFTGNFGGGLKWYAPNNRWGLRGDYRFGITKSKDDAPAFFGQDTRYVHRVYGAVVINTAK